MKTPITTLVLLIAAATGMQAADGVTVKDLRLGLMSMPADVSTEWTIDDGGGSVSDTYDRETDGRSRVSLGMVGTVGPAAPAALLYGIGVAFETAEFSGYDDSWGEEISQSWAGFIINGQLGVAFAVNDMFHVEAAGVLGLGAGAVEITDVSGLEFGTASAAILEYGLRLGGYFTVQRLQLGLEVGYMNTSYMGAEWEDANDPSFTYAEDAEFSGTFVGLTLGFRV